jgi:2-phosphosulfolactate phosphatase
MTPSHLEVLDTPAEFSALAGQELPDTVCVVIDVLRATTSMVAALDAGAAALLPVDSIPEAIEARRQDPALLLAGERHGLRIRANQSGGVDFDFGNSPREFTAQRVAGRRIAITTTNGTRALRACAGASHTFLTCLLNLQSTIDTVRTLQPHRLVLVASGTFEEPALEDVFTAGAICEAVLDLYHTRQVSDSAWIARLTYQQFRHDPAAALRHSRNGRKLLSLPELADDVAFSSRRNVTRLVAALHSDGWVRPFTPQAIPEAAPAPSTA